MKRHIFMCLLLVCFDVISLKICLIAEKFRMILYTLLFHPSTSQYNPTSDVSCLILAGGASQRANAGAETCSSSAFTTQLPGCLRERLASPH